MAVVVVISSTSSSIHHLVLFVVVVHIVVTFILKFIDDKKPPSCHFSASFRLWQWVRTNIHQSSAGGQNKYTSRASSPGSPVPGEEREGKTENVGCLLRWSLFVGGEIKQEEGREAEETARLDTTEETHAPRTRYERIGPGTRQYEDNRARIIMLQPHGPAWTKRLQGAWHLLQTHPMLASCLLPPG